MHTASITPGPLRHRSTPVHRAVLAVLIALVAIAMGAVLRAAPVIAGPAYAYTVSTLPAGAGPLAVAVDQSTHTAYVAAPNNNALSAIDTRTDTVTATISLDHDGWAPGLPFSIAVDASAHRVFVGLAASTGYTAIIDTTTNTLIGRTSGGAAEMTVDETDHLLYIVDVSGLVVVDTRTGQNVTTIADPNYPQAVAVDEGTHTAYVADRTGLDRSVGGSVSIIDTRTQQVTGHLAVGANPRGVAVDQSTHTAYVTNSNSFYALGSVSVIDGATNTVTTTIPVGSVPWGVTVDQGTHTVYVTNYAITTSSATASTSTVSVIDGATKQVAGTLEVGRAPRSVAVDDTTHTAYVPNSVEFPNSPGGTLSVLAAHGDRRITATTVATTPTPAIARAPITLSATITPSTATGTVTFHEGARALPGACAGAVPVINGIATCTAVLPFTAEVDLQADYSGDTTLAPSPGYGPILVTNPLTTTTISATPNAAVGVSVALFATVIPTTEMGDSVDFTDNGVPIPGCGGDLLPGAGNANNASCITTFTTPGLHTITASYGGNTYLAGSSATISVIVAGTPDFFQTVLGYLITLAHNLHLFGL